jgi:hypothetical protein
MQANSKLYRQVSAANITASVYPVMEDERRRKNEKEIKRKKERGV